MPNRHFLDYAGALLDQRHFLGLAHLDCALSSRVAKALSQ
jgi:hypothetical protein